jgi:NADH-quinone oxidoreductase subunit N
MTLPEGFLVWSVLAPALLLLGFAMLTLLLAVFQPDRRFVAGIALTGVLSAGVFAFNLLMEAHAGAAAAGFGVRYLADTHATAFTLVILLGTALAVLVGQGTLERLGLDHPEYFPLLLLSATGAVVMVCAGDLITLLLGLEIMSLAVYALAAWRTDARPSQEAGLKYFLLGAFGSALLIYGIALTYGASGYFDYANLMAAFTAPGFDAHVTALIGAVLVLAGLGFKVAFVPFHQWAPDVYTGAPTPVTAFMAVVVKTAAFGALLRVASTVFASLETGALGALLPGILVVLVGATLVVGNLGALLQAGVKRMLAYSAVAHAGYLGLAVLAASGTGMAAAGFYLIAYTLTSVGAFAILSHVMDADERGDTIEHFAGLGRSRPALAAALAVCLLSLAGIPPLAGFVGKVLVIQAAIAAGHAALAVLAIATSVVAVVYYARVVVAMYFREPVGRLTRVTEPAIRRSLAAAIGIAVAGTVLLGVAPGLWYTLLDQGQQLLAFVPVR